MSTTETNQPQVARGLEGIVAAATNIAEVDGQNGKLTLRGYDISELSGNVIFEEVAYLLWHGKLPNQTELNALLSTMSAARELPSEVVQCLKTIGNKATGMDIVLYSYPGKDGVRHKCQPSLHMPTASAKVWKSYIQSLSITLLQGSFICLRVLSHHSHVSMP